MTHTKQAARAIVAAWNSRHTLSLADHQIEPITVRVFVIDGLCEQVFRNHPNRRMEVALKAEVYSGESDCHGEYETALAECWQGSEWTLIR
jgi:hypothetical protein